MIFEACDVTELSTLAGYLTEVAPIDMYLEHRILDSSFHRIVVDGAEAGAFGILDGAQLTHFQLVGPARRFGQPALRRIMAEFPVASALLGTSDEFMLSHVLDLEHTLVLQAYTFVEGGAPPEHGETTVAYRPARADDIPAIVAVSGDFLDLLEERVGRGELHVGTLDGALVAVGIVEAGRYLTGYASIGMFTHEEFRRRGLGTATLHYLRRVCRERGLAQVAGCAYPNRLSKQTLEAAGMVAVSRLLRCEFARPRTAG